MDSSKDFYDFLTLNMESCVCWTSVGIFNEFQT